MKQFTSKRTLFQLQGKRGFSSTPLKTQVCIIGSGPVGMTLSIILNKLNVPNIIAEKYPSLQEHPKAHYISFRTCEILKDLELGHEFEETLQSMPRWAKYNYQTYVIGGKVYAEVDHFNNYKKAMGLPNDTDVLADFRERFTYAYPNHFPQHKLNSLLLRKLKEQNSTILTNHAYKGHKKLEDRVQVDIEDRELGKVIQVECRHLVGADGVKSRVREDLGIQLRGQKGKDSFALNHFRHVELCEHPLSLSRHRQTYAQWLSLAQPKAHIRHAILPLQQRHSGSACLS
ncbi:hypothetical protein FGO68_gene14059 [Halteria grandinella]|uniref:FAD-binding domain-containing protein n=1 Tax=Halteria grandinella TaxID=5974 RepID=A0A8J8NCL7_HALGN|nr:hypothetical protein FGO68_gene14059 [Halteria grandinella]